MNTEFRKAILPEETRSLGAFDRKVFLRADWFPPSYWKTCECYWMLVENKKVGCCAFQSRGQFPTDLDDGKSKSLYISTTGILPRFQGQGFGAVMKYWQIAYGRRHGFDRIVTNCRKRNRAMISLNKKCGFRVIRSIPRYYSDPSDSTVVMEYVYQ
jgi:ribosomal protein S18 acetylase RimI-like enzyme